MTDTLTHNRVDIDDLDALYPAGEPLPESEPHELVRSDAATVLRQHFADCGNVWVGSNRNVYYCEDDLAVVRECLYQSPRP